MTSPTNPTVLARADGWLFEPGPARRLAALRSGLAGVVLLRIVLWPFMALATTPAALFTPPLFLSWLGGFPSRPVIFAIQLAGAGAAIGALVARRGAAASFRFAWLALLVLGGLKTSTGKILHNDVAVLLAAVPVVLCSSDARLDDDRCDASFGWPLRAALVTLASVYFMCGLQKLHHSGLSWVTSDNMRWILAGGAASGRAPTTWLATALASSPALSHVVAGGLLGVELAFPIVLFARRTRPWFAIGAVLLHTGTWLTLGLDYWAWSLAAVVVVGLSALDGRPQSGAGGRAMSSAIFEKSTEMKMPSASARSSPSDVRRPAVKIFRPSTRKSSPTN